jgi:MFS transporter, ACS family, tartrate transporter
MVTDNMIAASDVATTTISKLRRRIIPILFLLYVVAYLDRINISFAALTMNSALGITSAQYGLLTGIFFLGYFLFEIPSNLLLHKIGARIWIARILISWGVVAMLTGLVRSVHQLYVLRFLLGLAEAGYFPGMVLYLTYWFREREQARAIAWFMIGLPVASIIGAPTSGVILDHAHWLAISSWRWLLILEGLPAIGCGILTYLLLPSRPAEARFLVRDEKDWIAAALLREERQKLGVRSLSAAQVLASGRVWHLAAIAFSFDVGLNAMSFFMPQAVKSLSSHYSNTVVGVLVMIPNLVGLAAMVLVSRNSDRRLERRYHAAVPAIVGGVALILVGRATSPFLAVALWSLAAAGIYGIIGPFWSIPSEFLTGFSAACGIALINSIGNLGGFIGPFAIGAIALKTGGIYPGLALAGVSLLVSATLILLLPKESAADRPVSDMEGELAIG